MTFCLCLNRAGKVSTGNTLYRLVQVLQEDCIETLLKKKQKKCNSFKDGVSSEGAYCRGHRAACEIGLRNTPSGVYGQGVLLDKILRYAGKRSPPFACLLETFLEAKQGGQNRVRSPPFACSLKTHWRQNRVLSYRENNVKRKIRTHLDLLNIPR